MPATGKLAVDAAASAEEGGIYTCPMHPDIRQAGPGSCPICGMALEPVRTAREAEPSPELADMTRSLGFGAILALPVFVLEMGGHLFSRFPASARTNDLMLGPTHSHDARRVMGGRPILRAWLGVASVATSQHVYFDCDGHGRRLGLQRRGHPCAWSISNRVAVDGTAPPPVISKRPPRSRCSRSSDKSWSCAHGKQPRCLQSSAQPCGQDGAKVILLSPTLAAAAMTLSSVSVISNAVRLYRVRI
jgi:Heavy metal binding domain